MSLGNIKLLRDVYNKLNSSFGQVANKRIAVLKTLEQSKGGLLGNVSSLGDFSSTGVFIGSQLFNGNLLASTLGGSLGALFGLTGKNIYADVIFSYGHKSSIKLTDNPVENGALVNDHRILEARTLSIEIGINNSNVRAGNVGDILLRGAALVLFGDSSNSVDKVLNTYTDLNSCMKNGEPFDIDTPLGTYSNMLITSIEANQDAENINVFRGTINFKELIQIELKESSKKSKTSGVYKALETGVKKATAIGILPTNTMNAIRSVL